MGLFRRRQRVADVVAQLAELDQRLAAEREQSVALQARLITLESKPLPAPVPVPRVDDIAAKVRALLGEPSPTIDPRRLDELEARHERLENRVVELADALTNQLRELNGELDTTEHAVALRIRELERRLDIAPAAIASGAAPAADQLHELQANQVRIANELARFSIAVRQEMAALAPRVTAGARR